MHRATKTILPSLQRLHGLFHSLPHPIRKPPFPNPLPFTSFHTTHPFSSSSPPLNPSTDPSESPPTQESVLYVLKKLDKKPSKALEFFNHVASNYNFHPGSSACNLLLRILGHKDHITHFWLFLKTMQQRGHSIDKGTYFTLLTNFKKQGMPADSAALTKFYSRKAQDVVADASIASVSKLLLESSSEDVGKKLGELNLSVSETAVVRILREIHDYPLKALGFFRWAAERPEYEHGSAAYNAMVRVLGRKDSMGEFWLQIQEMKGKGFEMDIDTYIKLSRQFLKGRMMEEAVELYEFMMDGPYKPAVQDCGMLLRQISLTETPNLDLVTRVVNKYEAAGHSLSKTVYDGIHRSLTSIGRFDEAEEIVGRMKEAGYEPDNITYSQLVYGLCKAKRFDEACEVLHEMEEGGCVPDLKTWTVLIQGQCSAGEVDRALQCLTKMIKTGLEADADLLDVLVKGLCGQNRAGGAYTLVVEMVEKARVRPWQAMYKFLIQELLREGKLEEALKILGLMKSHKFSPFADPFAPYISKFGTVEDAREFLKALSVKNYPSATAYLNLFKSFFDEGRYSEAQDLLFKCPHHIRKHADISKLFGSIEAGNAAQL